MRCFKVFIPHSTKFWWFEGVTDVSHLLHTYPRQRGTQNTRGNVYTWCSTYGVEHCMAVYSTIFYFLVEVVWLRLNLNQNANI